MGERDLVRELTAASEYARLRRDPVFGGRGVPHGDAQPVLLIPGFLTPDGAMTVMSRWLRRTGHHPVRAHIGINIGCAEEQAQRLERRLDGIAHHRGRRVAIVGYSRGGHLARVLAVRRPELVSGVVTLGAPPLDHRAIHPLVRVPPVAIAALGTVGVPRVFRASCFLGACCRRFRTELHGPFPETVGFVAVHSRIDGVVDSTLLSEQAADGVDVKATHLGMVVNADVYRALAEALRAFRSAER